MLKWFFGMFVLVALGCRSAGPPAARETFGPVWGPEDFEIQVSGPGSPRLLVASQKDVDRKDSPPGEIKEISLKGKEKPTSCDLGDRNGCSFHPHGVSLVTASDGRLLLYVINHQSALDVHCCLRGKNAQAYGDRVNSVEIYEVSEGEGCRLLLIDRLLNPLLTNPNDLAALPDGRIYITNAPVNRRFGFLYEGLIGHSSSSIVMYDGHSWHRATFKPRIANGIAVDGARGRLYVAETARKTVDVFAIDGPRRATAPEKVGEIKIGSGVDNLSWGPDGPEGRTLWVAADRNLFAFIRLGLAWNLKLSRKPLSPSEVYSIKLSGDCGEPNLVFSDDGQMISGASTAFPFDGSLLIGQVYDQFILRYPCPDPIRGCSVSKEGQ